MPRDKTNLASEFHVLSVLNRLGADAYLTLGNKKAVDIVVVRHDGQTVDVEVKAVAGKHDWTVGQLCSDHSERHFVVLVSFNGSARDTQAMPSCWVLPYKIAQELIVKYITKNGIRRNIPRRAVTDQCAQYFNAWPNLLGGNAQPGGAGDAPQAAHL